jgi:wyosine [tRNA(Phe)-imidazoG37] synthetase (radical SAM superfamily)
MLNRLKRCTDPAYMAWRKTRDLILRQNAEISRLDCMNPVVALNRFVQTYPNSSMPSVNLDSLIKEWSSINGIEGQQLIPSIGVRDSLLSIFRNLGVKRPIYIGKHVYPVYQFIGKMCGNNLKEFDTLPTIDLAGVLNSIVADNAVILITKDDRIGRNKKDIDLIINWLRKSDGRLIIYDAVYTYNYHRSYFDELYKTGQVITCHSMSKSYLLPLHLGISAVPNGHEKLMSDVSLPNQEQMAVAYHRLTTYPELPGLQHELFNSEWKRLSPQIKEVFPRWEKPSQGYFSRIPMSLSELQTKGILGIPATVFNCNEPISIVTCIHDIQVPSGFDCVMYHVIPLSQFAKGYDKYSSSFSKTNITESTFPNKFHLLYKNSIQIGVTKVSRLLKTINIAGDRLLIIKTSVPHKDDDEEKPYGTIINDNKISVTNLQLDSVDGTVVSVEDAYAMSMKLISNSLTPYDKLVPRTISVLPIAKGCQAKCPFCFSHASISDEQRQRPLTEIIVDKALRESKKRGAERAVITGGGEPTMLPHDRLIRLMQQCGNYFGKVVMITNGYNLGHMGEDERYTTLLEYENAGLTVLSVSRHAANNVQNKKIMHVDTFSERVANTMGKNNFDRLKMRWVCVLQKGGVSNMDEIEEYIDWTISTGVKEVCFKELYVSTSEESVYHNNESNVWSRNNQISLKLVLDFVKKNNGVKVNQLPWESPIFKIIRNNTELLIAAYTEPTVYWERANNMCRSWNLLADASCYASLEDKASKLEF